MESFDDMKKRQEKEFENLKLQHEIANSMPLPTDRVMLTGKRAPWITYKAETLKEALEIFKVFKDYLVDMVYAKGTFGHICPESEIGSDKTYKIKGDYLLALVVEHGVEYGSSVKLFFYVKVQDRLVRINVDLEKKQFSRWAFNKYAPFAWEEHDRTGRVSARHFKPNNTLNGYADKVVTFASGDMGPVKKSADHRYLFVNDFEHVVGQLGNMSEEFDNENQG